MGVERGSLVLADISGYTSYLAGVELEHSHDVKLIAHSGEFVVRVIAGNEELVGSDVIVVHRLLKNSVAERLHLKGYAILTEAFLRSCGIDSAALDLREHVETYQDVGEIRGRVLDLQRRWLEADAGRFAYIEAQEAVRSVSVDLSAAPGVVWSYLTDPAKRPLWTKGVKRVEQENPEGIPGIGTRNHCVHGRSASDEEILDWKPFSYFTWSSRTSAGMFTMMCELEPLAEPDTTRVTWRISANGTKERIALKLVWRQLRKDLEQGMRTIPRYAARELEVAAPGDRLMGS